VWGVLCGSFAIAVIVSMGRKTVGAMLMSSMSWVGQWVSSPCFNWVRA